MAVKIDRLTICDSGFGGWVRVRWINWEGEDVEVVIQSAVGGEDDAGSVMVRRCSENKHHQSEQRTQK